ncbi:unnamed protein product (mitochondrion) [Plasmodiophora brassicae]|uniref:Trichohyalin-plectin-homology domain-containing protein n=1 Tax=Plasmodiophora brassicae TaxID=37360 RepID=A0A3P3YBU9_PLABS|nr:unnamed protein product [Plasmodiophora brassicae]
MLKVRQSIINRPIRPVASRATQESIDSEYALETSRAESRRQRRQALIRERQRCLFGTPEEKAQIAHEVKTNQEELERAKEAIARDEERRDAWVMEGARRREEMVNAMAMNDNAARRRYLQMLRDDNRKLAEYRQRLRKEQEESEKREARQGATFCDRFGRNAIS